MGAAQPLVIIGERWRRIPGFDQYSVSSIGRVRTDVFRGETVIRLRRLNRSPNGYLIIPLRRNKKSHFRYVHRVVAEAFFGPPRVGNHAAHLNGIKTDNRVENLRWVTPKENASHKILHGTALMGEDSPNAKLTELQVREIKLRFSLGQSRKDIADKFPVSFAMICYIIRGQCWTHVKI